MAQSMAVRPAAQAVDVLSPAIARRTRKILALQEKGRAKMREMANIIADIGDELIAVKEELDRGKDKEAWTRWLKTHVQYTPQTARNYMRVASFRRVKGKTFFLFEGVDPACLYRICSLPDKCCKGLTPETKLTDPKTGETKPMKEMSARQLDRALDKLERKGGSSVPEFKSPGVPGGATTTDIETGTARLSGDDRESFAAAVRAAIERLAADAGRMRSLGGKLKGESKQSAIASAEVLRKALLKWPAFAR